MFRVILLLVGLLSTVPAAAQPDNLDDRRASTDKQREQIILRLKKTQLIERVDVHGGHGRLYVGAAFYYRYISREEQARNIRIIAGYSGV